MADKTGIAWTESTWSPFGGCSDASAGCKNCYARTLAWRFRSKPHYSGLVRKRASGRLQWTGELRVHAHLLDQPLRWRRPRMIFVNSQSDTFHEEIGKPMIAELFAHMWAARHHTFQVLTKRAARARELLSSPIFHDAVDLAVDSLINRQGPKLGSELKALARAERSRRVRPTGGRIQWPLPNVWLGVSAENQTRAEERVPELLATPAALRFVSAEPLLGPVDFSMMADGVGLGEGGPWVNALRGWSHDSRGDGCGVPALDWIIVGGESGPGARECRVEWVRNIVADCAETGTAVFVKQLGDRPTLNVEDVGRLPLSGAGRKGEDWEKWPPSTRVRQWPEGYGRATT